VSAIQADDDAQWSCGEPVSMGPVQLLGEVQVLQDEASLCHRRTQADRQTPSIDVILAPTERDHTATDRTGDYFSLVSVWPSSGADQRMTEQDDHPVNGPLQRLIDAWCERRDLRHLALLLPAYTSNSGLTDGWAGVMDALYNLRAARTLPDDEQAEIERIIPLVERMVYRP
jgi:hypothetical protein